ncbi:MAG: GTP pyrophosphokinase family protein [Clostridia bacterium]|nr:GTP pyrophosphokinase family protein [Clostridia bacterium]
MKKINKHEKERLAQAILDPEIREQLDTLSAPYKELMAYYRCAMMEVATKFNVLSEALSLDYDRNPIEAIKTRIKTPESILEKLNRRGLPLTLETIESSIYDVAGIRIICSFPSDIYMLADCLLSQDDIILIDKKDYLKSPKKTGYRSLHLIVGIPIYLHDQKKIMNVEVQLRTMSMDWWASLEHKIRYKKDLENPEEFEHQLYECAETSARLDIQMEELYKKTL